MIKKIHNLYEIFDQKQNPNVMITEAVPILGSKICYTVSMMMMIINKR